MFLLIIFSFLAGLVTILSPCILPLLPIILSSASGSKQRPLGVITGFVASFTFFTLFLASIVKFSGVSADSLRFLSVVVLMVFGLSLLVPAIQIKLELLFSKLANLTPVGQNKANYLGGILVGLSLGLLWTPCVGPILASVITLALAGTISTQAFLITLAYSLGTAIPMLVIMLVGAKALQKVPWLVKHTKTIQQVFGLLMMVTALAIYFNFDRKFQSYILKTFPNYGVGLTKFEENEQVTNQLNQLNQTLVDKQMIGKPINQPKGSPAPELILGGKWFNSEPLTLAELKGKVVLIDFWTYTCINCQRTFPYLRNWWNKYHDDGLVIIGVHSPEFEFEKNPTNVEQALFDFDLNYPVMQDNDFSTWRAYHNRFWPAKYLIDKDGNIRYTHFGEGGYDETEEMIKKLLIESGSDVSQKEVNNPKYRTYAITPESYLGYARLQYLVSPELVKKDQLVSYSVPSVLQSNSFAYQGDWQLTAEYAQPEANSNLYFNFEAKEVFLVMRPKNKTGTVKVYLDGKLTSSGEDVVDGEVEVNEDRLYKLIMLDNPGKHQLRLEFPDSSLELYAFTFG